MEEEELVVLEATMDGVQIHISRTNAAEMTTVASVLEDVGMCDPIVVPRACGPALLRFGAFFQGTLEPFQLMRDDDFFELLRIANYLDAARLVALMIPHLARRLLDSGDSQWYSEFGALLFVAIGFLSTRIEAHAFYMASRRYIYRKNELTAAIFRSATWKERLFGRFGRSADIRLILDHYGARYQAAYTRSNLLEIALTHDNLAVAQVLIREYQQPIGTGLETTIANGSFNTFSWLLAAGVAFIEYPHDAFMLAVRANQLEMVSFFMLCGYDPSTNNNDALDRAACDGLHEMVVLLLQDERVDPNDIFVSSIHWHDFKLFQILWNDPRTDPSVDHNEAVRIAAVRGFVEVMRILLADPRVDPSDENNVAASAAARNGHADVLEMLLADPRVDPSGIRRNSLPFQSTAVEAVLRKHKRKKIKRT